MHDVIALEAGLAPAAAALGARTRALHLPANRRPWLGTGLRLRRGQSYTLIGSGRIGWSARHPHLHGGPGFHLWARVAPGGRIVNVTRDSGSFVADVDGELEHALPLALRLTQRRRRQGREPVQRVGRSLPTPLGETLLALLGSLLSRLGTDEPSKMRLFQTGEARGGRLNVGA